MAVNSTCHRATLTACWSSIPRPTRWETSSSSACRPWQARSLSDGATLYATDSAAGHVVPVAIGNRQVARPISIGQSPVTAELTPGGDILAVVDTASDDLAVIRTQTSSLITLIPTGPQPRSLAIKVF